MGREFSTLYDHADWIGFNVYRDGAFGSTWVNVDGIAEQVIDGWRRDLALLALGMVARADTLRDAAITKGGANSVHIEAGPQGRGHLSATLEFDSETHVPVRITYRDRIQVFERGSVLRPAGTPRGEGQGRPVEPTDELVTMEFGERREVNGVLLPFRVTTTAKGILLQEMRFTRIVGNPVFTAQDLQ